MIAILERIFWDIVCLGILAGLAVAGIYVLVGLGKLVRWIAVSLWRVL